MGDMHHTIGSMTEAMFYPKIWEKFRSLGYTFAHGENRKHWIDGKKHIAEADIYMENGEYAMLVEVKTTLREEHVDEHLKRLNTVKKYLDKRGESRKLLGAVGGAVVPESVKNYALKKGLYVLIQSGEAVILAKTGKGFTAAVW
jgi:hypothetical protein